jgi:hypothetical protein
VSDGEDRIIDMMQDNFNHLREDIGNRLDKIESKLDKVITDEDCKKNRKNCVKEFELKSTAMSIKKVSVIGGVVTGTITASAAAVALILKIF